MNSIIRVMCAVNRVVPSDAGACADSIEAIIESRADAAFDIAVFPTPALCSPAMGSFFGSASLRDALEAALDRLCLLSARHDCFIVAGLPVYDAGAASLAAAVIHAGHIVGLVGDDNPPAGLSPALSQRFLPRDTVFSCGGFKFVVVPGGPQNLACNALGLPGTDFDFIISTGYERATAGSRQAGMDGAGALSRALGCAVVLANGGVGDTSFPGVYRGYAAIFECGELLASASDDEDELCVVCDLDRDIIAAHKKASRPAQIFFAATSNKEKRGLLRSVGKTPYLPVGEEQKNAWLDDLFELSVRALAARMQNTRIERLVLGVSGGLDSTLALLVSAKALDRQGLGRENLTGVTMPGFGTSERTYFNALGLLEALGADARDISISASATQGFEDIGHSPDVRNITYENVQARARSAILFNLANELGALAVGTGDLSESALGWCTFGGDHLAGYNVNISIPKTVIRLMLSRLADIGEPPGTDDYLRDVLDTPISPELLPAARPGGIGHKTEEILGPYELHDFFLYYFVRYRFRPAKLYYYACIAFSGEYDPGYILDKLKLFIRRFVASQFKRSCAPDAALLTEFCLHPYCFSFPSDISPDFLLEELESAGF